MDDARVILITGAAGQWGSRLAGRLLAESNLRVLGLDYQRPEAPPPGLDFIQADLQDPLLADLLALEEVDTVCHLAFWDTPRYHEAAFEFNVRGTDKLLEACATAGVQQILFKSSTAVYGAHADNPAFLTEEHPLRGRRSHPAVHSLLETEALSNAFRRESSATVLTVLRFAPIVGPTVDTALTRYLRGKTAATLLGFNPMMQVVHEEDVVEALARAVLRPVDGAINVAADPPLPLNRLLALAGVLPLPVPHPLAGLPLPIPFRPPLLLEPDYLRYRWTVDTGRMSEQLGFYPQHGADESLQAFRQEKRPAHLPPQQTTGRSRPAPLHLTLAARRQAGAATPET